MDSQFSLAWSWRVFHPMIMYRAGTCWHFSRALTAESRRQTSLKSRGKGADIWRDLFSFPFVVVDLHSTRSKSTNERATAQSEPSAKSNNKKPGFPPRQYSTHSLNWPFSPLLIIQKNYTRIPRVIHDPMGFLIFLNQNFRFLCKIKHTHTQCCNILNILERETMTPPTQRVNLNTTCS